MKLLKIIVSLWLVLLSTTVVFADNSKVLEVTTEEVSDVSIIESVEHPTEEEEINSDNSNSDSPDDIEELTMEIITNSEGQIVEPTVSPRPDTLEELNEGLPDDIQVIENSDFPLEEPAAELQTELETEIEETTLSLGYKPERETEAETGYVIDKENLETIKLTDSLAIESSLVFMIILLVIIVVIVGILLVSIHNSKVKDDYEPEDPPHLDKETEDNTDDN